MVKAVILKTNGKFEEKDMKSLEDYQEAVGGGYVERLPRCKAHYFLPATGEQGMPVEAYANEEGMMRQLPSNPWSGFLMAIGFHITWNMVLFGDIVLFGKGEKRHIDPALVELIKECKRQDDGKEDDCDIDAFFCALEKAQEKGNKAPVSQKKGKEPVPSENECEERTPKSGPAEEKRKKEKRQKKNKETRKSKKSAVDSLESKGKKRKADSPEPEKAEESVNRNVK